MCSLCVSDGLKIQDNLTSRVGQCAGEHDAVTSRVQPFRLINYDTVSSKVPQGSRKHHGP